MSHSDPPLSNDLALRDHKNFVFGTMNFSNRLRKEIASAQHVAHLTDQWFSALFVEESLCHSVCRSSCNWNSIAFWIQVSASLLLSGQSSVKDIKHPSGNYSLASKNASKLCLIITQDALVWPNRLRRKIRCVFLDIGCIHKVDYRGHTRSLNVLNLPQGQPMKQF